MIDIDEDTGRIVVDVVGMTAVSVASVYLTNDLIKRLTK